MIEKLLPALVENDAKGSPPSMEVVGVTALALGMIAVGSNNSDVVSTLLQTLIEKSEAKGDLKECYAKFLPLGIGLCFLGKQVRVRVGLNYRLCTKFDLRDLCTSMLEYSDLVSSLLGRCRGYDRGSGGALRPCLPRHGHDPGRRLCLRWHGKRP